MTKIWYSVLGDGMGHAIRSDAILERITKEHDVMITATKKAYHFLKEKYPNVHEIEGHELIYEENSVKIKKTIKDFFKEFPAKSKYNMKKISLLINNFRPDIIITDFEAAAHYFSYLLKIPCISIDNVHVLSECKVGKIPENEFKLKSVLFLMKLLHPMIDHYIITTFAEVKPKHKNVTLVPPIIRKFVRKQKSGKKEHVLVYQTTSTNLKMLKILKKSKNKFKIYGMNKKGKQGNLEFMPFSETQIIKDMKNAKYVIINGGFTVISEALHFRKPILSIPLEEQTEQIFNGYSLKVKGYGDYTNILTYDFLTKFEKNLEIFEKNLKEVPEWDHNKLFEVTEKLIKKLTKKSKPRYELLKIIIKKQNKIEKKTN